MKAYNRFAYLYDELMSDFDYENWYRYIKGIFARYDKSPREILEMACGTGNLSYYFAKDGTSLLVLIYQMKCFLLLMKN